MRLLFVEHKLLFPTLVVLHDQIHRQIFFCVKEIFRSLDNLTLAGVATYENIEQYCVEPAASGEEVISAPHEAACGVPTTRLPLMLNAGFVLLGRT
jgi:hypothetical protein